MVTTKKSAKKPAEAIKESEIAVEEGTRALVPIQQQAVTIIEKAAAITKIRTDEDRKLVAFSLTSNKDLQKIIKAFFKPMKEATDAAHTAVCDQEHEVLDPLVADEDRCKKLNNEDRLKQEHIAEEKRRKLQAEADRKAKEQREKEVRAIRVQEFRAMMKDFDLTPEVERLFKAADGKKFADMNEDDIAVVAEYYETYLETRKAFSVEYKTLFQALKKEGAKPEGVAAAVAATPVQAARVVVENKADTAAAAAGLTFKITRHMEVVDESQIERQYLVVNQDSIKAAALAYWKQIEPKDPKDAAQYATAVAKFSGWQGVKGVRFWITKESADTGRR